MALDPDSSHLCLYNLAPFHELNIRGSQRYHRIDFILANRLVGSLAGIIDKATFTSGYSAGFGGPDFRRDGEQLDVVEALLDHCVAQLASVGVNEIVIRAKPVHYSASEQFLHFALLRRRFSIVDSSLNFYLDLHRLGSAEAYRESLKSSARRALGHALKARHSWRKAEEEQDWQAGYRALQANRRDFHSAELSLSYDYITGLRQRFGDRIEMYNLEVNSAIAAASLVYRITPRHSQVMYWGDCARGSVPGLMNLVADYTVQTGIAQRLSAIDLGPSASLDAENRGGIAFKTAIGALPNMRYTYRRSI